MGWWDSDILGGDGPLNALAGLQKFTDWTESEGLYEAQGDASRKKLTARLQKHFGKAEVVKKTKEFITKLTNREDSHTDILAVVYVLIKLKIKFDNFVEQLALTALAHDEIDEGWHDSAGRKEAREDFKRRLDAFRGRQPETLLFEVCVTKHTTDSGTVRATAVSAREAKKIVIKRVESGAVELNGMPTVKCEVDEVLQVEEVFNQTKIVKSDQ